MKAPQINRKGPSPLYTPKMDADFKRSVLSERGRDCDGAFRLHGRKDESPNYSRVAALTPLPALLSCKLIRVRNGTI